LGDLFDPLDEEPDRAQIRETLSDWARTARLADFDEPISLDVVRGHLVEALGPSATGWRFLSGGVTFCALRPMGGLPFRVVCLIGMNDGAFPRSTRKLGFDLMANDFRRGDRSRREDDRYLFLETLLSARESLYMSYVGQDIRDNSELPPSVLVSELLDHLERGFVCESGRSVREHILVRHPLQAFSRRYFTGDGQLFSYSKALCAAVQKASTDPQDIKPLFTGTLSEAAAERRMLSIEDLSRFLGHPARYLLQVRLGLYLDAVEEPLPAHEPFVLDGLEGWSVRQRLLELQLETGRAREALSLFRAGGLLPHGRVGEVNFGKQVNAVMAFAGRLGGQWPPEFLEPIDFDLVSEEMRLNGRLNGVTPRGLMGSRLSKVSARDILTLWVRHLALNAIAPNGIERTSLWVGEDKTICLGPVEGANDLLQELLGIYWQGLHRVLPFFPKSALAYANALGKGRDHPLKAARQEWLGSEFSPGECQDPYFDLCYRGLDPLDDEFTRLAQAVFGPALTAMTDQQ